MSKISITAFDGACELLSYEEIADGRLEIKADTVIEGKLFIDSAVFEMAGGECNIDLQILPDGTYTPLLYGKRDMTVFPRIEKIGNMVRPIIDGEAEMLLAAKRAREAVREVRSLKVEIARLRALIEGSRLAIGLK